MDRMGVLDGQAILSALGGLPGGPELLDLASTREDVELVGGAVRDLSLGRTPRELDVVVGRDAQGFASELVGALSEDATDGPGDARGTHTGAPEATFHERFGTALVRGDGVRIDIATRRAESYPTPGSLPEVREGSPEEDLHRRDFTVNAIAVPLSVPLSGPRPREVRAVDHALEDLEGGRLRVLHDRSFLDDPTRLFRLARYRGRLAFQIETHTHNLAQEAVEGGALSTVSGSRIGAELRLAFREPDAVRSLAAMDDLGLLKALSPHLRFDEPMARASLEILSLADAPKGDDREVEDVRPDLLLLSVLLQPMAFGLEEGVEEEMYTLLDRLEFPANDRDVAIRSAIRADALADDFDRSEELSDVYEAASFEPPELVALAGGWAEINGSKFSDAPNTARHWLEELRNVRLSITGEDLLAAGVPEGPEIGRRLDAAMIRKLARELDPGPEAELAAALEARV
jgi:tRNA nucleotidyltransferase (CCA-adding enzyme)